MWPLAKYVLENYLPRASSATGQVVVYLIFALAGAGILLGFASAFAGVSSFVERRVAARMMSRVGPNRVGPQGLLQFMADGLKLVLKEDLIPVGANRLLFRIAPYFVFAGMFGTFVALPFSARLVAANLDVGILYILSITALVVVGIILGGWSSNSKWSLFGGLRSAAQIISYEIPAGLAVLVVVLHAGGLSTQRIIEAQGGMPWNWFIFYSPFSLIAFPVYFTAALAEGNRTPFDLPEAESELVAGYSTEYSGFRFVVFFFAEWANLWIMSAIAVLCFFGGWRIPFVSVAATYSTWYLILLGLAIFCFKTLTLVLVVIQLRWTLPRLRVDQMMSMCWKYLIPIAFVCILGTMTWIVFVGQDTMPGTAARFVLFAAGAAIAVRQIVRTWFNYRADRATYTKLTGQPLWYPPYRLP
ncbi:MAG: NADH-quinone oxidoreductase subunit NuoH [Candidatus Brocadiia bacterium]|jgi:NADH-quinone oxidoreductase subunit H